MPEPIVQWDVVEEHLEDAAFLHAQWESALVDPEYTLPEFLDGPEQRMLAHLHGLAVAGRRRGSSCRRWRATIPTWPSPPPTRSSRWATATCSIPS